MKQVSVFMENCPGSLSRITEILSTNKVDVRAINIADSTEFGILRMIVDDADRTERILRQNGLTANIAEVFAVSLADTVGSLHQLVTILKEKMINIEYVYSFIGEKNKAVIVIKTNDNDTAIDWLKKKDINIISVEGLR